MKLNEGKKIILLGLILLILAGIIVVALKGFNVSILYKQHEDLSIRFSKVINIDDVKDVAKEVFGKDDYEIRKLDLFNDSVIISKENYTDENKNDLVSKLNEKLEESLTVEELTIENVPNVRLRDFARVYTKPFIIAGLLIAVYMIIRFNKMTAWKVLLKIAAEIILTEATIASIIAIIRLPITPVVINIMAVTAVVEIVLYLVKLEKEYKKLSAEE